MYTPAACPVTAEQPAMLWSESGQDSLPGSISPAVVDLSP